MNRTYRLIIILTSTSFPVVGIWLLEVFMPKKKQGFTPQVSEQVPVFKTVREALEHKFITKILGKKWPFKLNQKLTLADFAEDKRFEQDFVQMFIDRVLIEFHESIIQRKNKPIKEILDYLEKKQWGNIHYGGRRK